MRGKKADIDFINDFVTQCLNSNKKSTDDFVHEANLKISEIDNKIKEAEKLKIYRSKLIDVVNHFGPNKKENIDLTYYNLPHQSICKAICELISNSEINIEQINIKNDNLFFCIKKMHELKIIKKENNIISKHVNYNNYMSIFKE